MSIRSALNDRIQHGGSKDDIIKDVQKQTGSLISSVERIYRSLVKTNTGRTLSEFKQEYDKNTYIPVKIKKALSELGNSWEYESEFVKRSGVNYTDLNIFRDMFSENFVLLKREGKKIWCGTVSLANQLKELI